MLDADFAPRADMLDEMLPYMDDEPELGIVQSPQFFRVHRLGRTGWSAAPARCRSSSTGRCRCPGRTSDGAICVGSCAVYRRAALDDERRHHADRALRGRAHRVRPAAGAAGGCATCRWRCRPACARPTSELVLHPAVPLVHRAR